MTVDWPTLRAAAADVAARAYAPYSRLRVGAAGLTGDGRVVTGCNVENVSFGLTLCAECGLVSALHAVPPWQEGPSWQEGLSVLERPPGQDGALGHGRPPGQAADQRAAARAVPRLVAVAVVAGDGGPLLPCGRCRQLLLEAGGPGLLVDTAAGPVPLAELLPAAFDGADLSARRDDGN